MTKNYQPLIINAEETVCFYYHTKKEVFKISFLTIKLPQKATDDFMDILKKRKEALNRIANVSVEYNEEETREIISDEI